MIRMRSTGSQKSNNDNSPVNSANSSPIATTPKRLSLNSIMPNNSNNSPHSQLADHDDDDDDDLRSLLSGGSLNLNEIKLASKPQRPGQQSQKQKQKQQQKQQQQKQQQQQNQPQLGSQESGHHSSHITHLSSLLDDNNNSLTMSSTSSSSSSNHHNSNSKKSLWVLGTIILAVGFLGPSGLLWDMFEDSDEISPFHHNNQYNHHGDKHHHLSPPPPPNAEGMMINNDNQHPMIRSAHGIERATSAREYTKYHQFGSDAVKPREKMKRGRKKGGNADGGIKDAIQNIDKVFLDKVPRGMGADDDDAGDFFFTDDDNNEDGELLPVVHYNDGDTADGQRLDANADALDAYTYSQLPASDALECRASVIAFVINATDVRDECDGLRKAFDKTCSVVHQGAAQQQQQPPPQEGEGGGGSTAERQRRRRRRRLSEWGSPHLWNLIPEAYRREVQRAGGKVLHHVRHHVLRRGRNLFVREGGGTVRRAHNQTRRAMSVDHAVVERRTEEVAVGEEEQPVQEQPVQQQQQQQPIVSLNIPTADKHISEEMLADTLMLQESSDPKPARASSVDTQAAAPQEQQPQQQQPPDNVVTQNPEFVPEEQIAAHDAIAAAQLDGETDSNPPVPVAHPPNITAEAAEAVQDAAESANAIRTAVETVKTSMNDPKSVEARTCCASILSVFHEHCDPTTTGVEDYSDRRLLVVVFVITVCGMVKSLIRHLGIRWLPEAGGCILVGVLGYVILQHMPHVQFAFDGDMFLRIMVPPIVFEAAVKINKSSFKRHVIPICIFAIVGTLASTAFTAFILYKGTKMFSFVTTIPLKESMIFGALISSIDPIAVLSVLNNMGISDTDTLYMLIFGESLLNDGVAIVVFETLLHFLDESLVIDSEVMGDAFMHFVVVALGSVAVGALSGACATVYFSLMHGCQTPMVEVIMFCCWSFIPYYICDMVEWSGIVAIVANGFVMDLYVIGQKHHQQHSNNSTSLDDEIEFLVNGTGRRSSQGRCGRIFNYEGHLSQKADAHVHFVIEIFATLMETAIFAYLGLFLFSPRYHWSIYLTLISILATVLGRVLMIPLLSYVANFFNRLTRGRRDSAATSALSNNGIEGVHIDRRMQLVLVFAGLRGAMSFALVEHIPMYDTTTGQGSRFKPELKAMTSASVIFTLFVLGGATSYLMEKLGYSIGKQQNDNMELTPLVPQEKRRSPHTKRNGVFNMANGTSRSTVRQRGAR